MSFQWLVEWVWVPMLVLVAELYRELFNARGEIKRMSEEEEKRSRRDDITSTAIRNIESGIHSLGERLANIEGYLDGKKY